MAKKSKHIFPADVYVYVVDYLDGEPIFDIAQTLDEVDEGAVAIYVISAVGNKTTEHRFVKNDAI